MKFKEGDRVRCIENKLSEGVQADFGGYRGSGWEEGLTFTVNFTATFGTLPCCFGGKNGNGVYEPFLELLNTWKGKSR